MNDKFRLLEDNTITVEGKTLYRIQALKDFDDVSKGDVGGYVEKEDNLSIHGKSWIYDDARVTGNAMVADDACVCNDALVTDDARIFDNARIYDNAQVRDWAWIQGNGSIFDNAHVYGDAQIGHGVRVSGDAQIYGDVYIQGFFHIFGDADINGYKDLLTLSPMDGKNGRLIAFKSKKNDITVSLNSTGFKGTIQEFEKIANEQSNKQYEAAINLIKSTIK